MAYQNSGLLWTRGKCRDRFAHYKLCVSARPHAVDETGTGEVYWRVCSGCELDLRREEYAVWTDGTEASHGADYPAPAAIENFS